MRQPTIDTLLGKLDSKYGLVIATAKRAREITDGAKPAAECNSTEMKKPVSIALCEIGAGKLNIETPARGIK